MRIHQFSKKVRVHGRIGVLDTDTYPRIRYGVMLMYRGNVACETIIHRLQGNIHFIKHIHHIADFKTSVYISDKNIQCTMIL